eukprot:14265365-Alexandrium_andersonii.AAC.1
MSASLVGSEMCIRDRTVSRELFLPFGQSAARWPTSLHFQQRPANAPPLPCLLYTSDAADDM